MINKFKKNNYIYKQWKSENEMESYLQRIKKFLANSNFKPSKISLKNESEINILK